VSYFIGIFGFPVFGGGLIVQFGITIFSTRAAAELVLALILDQSPGASAAKTALLAWRRV
jgi:hypothetical protein